MDVEKIKNKYNKKNAIIVYSGELAIETVLINEKIGKGDYVVIPNNVCYRILNAIIRRESIPIIVRPENELVITDKDISKILENYNVKCILAVHQFGLKVDIKKLRSKCKNNEIIIEDIAQGWDIFSEEKTGSSSDYIVSSFGKGKPLDFGIGGIVLTNNNNIIDNMDYNNIQSRYSEKELIPYIMPYNSNLNLSELMNKADKKKRHNIKLARICYEEIKNKKINFYKIEKVEECYWERIPIWTEDTAIFKQMIAIAEKMGVSYEPYHNKMLEELHLLKNKKYTYINLSTKKRLFMLLKTEELKEKIIIDFIKEINKIK